MNVIHVFAPATVANVACGFDILGFALESPGDEVIMRATSTPKITITKITGDNQKLPFDPEKNTVSVPVLKLLEHLNSKQGFEIELHKNIPLSSGMGSSAASAVAGVFAANELLGRPLSTIELLPFAMEGERVACGSAHADNTGPSLLGGFAIIRSYEPLDVTKIKTPELFCALIHPDLIVHTADARKILKPEIPLPTAVKQWGNVAGLIAGLLNSDYELISRSLQDVVIEPQRARLIKGFYDVKNAALSAGALGASISGSGPSVFALCRTRAIAEKAAESMQKAFSKYDVSSQIFLSKINPNGPKIL